MDINQFQAEALAKIRKSAGFVEETPTPEPEPVVGAVEKVVAKVKRAAKKK